MPQQTNLDVSPYFDDYNPADDFYRVLFKPGYPVQARELTTLQSILQNQIEKFGQHFFKDGAKVIPGNTSYNNDYRGVQLNNLYQGIPVAAYADQLVGTKITGETSGITAVVNKVLLDQDSENGNLTLYVTYLSSSTANNSTVTFADGEQLSSNTTITSGLLGNTAITAGSPFGATISADAAITGSSYSIQEGVYFVRGQFIQCQAGTLILDQYSTNPNYRVGFFVNEEIITSDLDETLNDNSQGYNNYSAPGADRLKISLSLFKKNLTDEDDTNFIELGTITDGVLKSTPRQGFGVGPNGGVFYDDLEDVLARRTYDESGDYYVKPFDVTLRESLNDNINNRGLYQEGQITPMGDTPSDDLMIYNVSSGKAYVKGYEVGSNSPTLLDAAKPRTTKIIKDEGILYNTGAALKLNRSYGAPIVGVGNTYVLSLRDIRTLANQEIDPGSEIGVARVYDYNLESGSYDATNANVNQWDISLYDVETYVNLTVNEDITLSTPTYIKGTKSGATGFLRTAASATNSLTLYGVNGEFIVEEPLLFPGKNQDGTSISRVVTAVDVKSINDVKSVFGKVGGGNTFSADVIQSVGSFIGIASISAASSGFSTITSTNELFPGTLVSVTNLLKFSNTAQSDDPTYGIVTAIGTNTATIKAVADVNGVVNGNLPTTSLQVTDLEVLTTELDASSDDTLYTELPKPNIATVDNTTGSITIRKKFVVDIENGQLKASTIPTTGANETFLPFDEERYILIRSDGTTESLTTNQFVFTGGTQLQIYGLGSNDQDATLLTAITKVKPTSKEKIKNRVNSIVVNKSTIGGSGINTSGIGNTTLNDGLEYGNYPWGTRVQDDVISLNTPDIIKIHGVFESSTVGDASAPTAVLSSITSASTTTEEFILGEQIVGQTSGALAIVAEKVTPTQISFIYENEKVFIEGEILVAKESLVQGNVTTLESTSYNISNEFTYNNGQEGSFYNYGFLTRNAGVDAPVHKLKVYFMNGYYDSNDTGDVTTVESYKNFNYTDEIQTVNGIRNSDIIDIRPRVSDYTVGENTRSPLEFDGRTFNGAGNSAGAMLQSDGSILTTYSYYQGRIDRIFANKEGVFQVVYGTPADKPGLPLPVDDAIELATITLPPYLYDVSEASIKFLEYKRYQMKDIHNLADRVRNLEYYTALTLLESNTSNMFVSDSDGLNRFKSGFFVDNFATFLAQELKEGVKNSIDPANGELRPSHYTTSIDLMTGPVEGLMLLDVDENFIIPEGINIRKDNGIITLDYSELEWVKQTFGTRTESVTPYVVAYWTADITLSPESDTWVDQTRLEARIINREGNFAETISELSNTRGFDPQSGFGQTVWGSWQTFWTGQTTTQREMGQRSGPMETRERQRGRWIIRERRRLTRQVTVETGRQTRTGTRIEVREQFDRESQGDRTISRSLIPFMRSRNIEFTAKSLKPITRVYPFFDAQSVAEYCVPKLIEINMIDGTFQVGETVRGVSQTNWSADSGSANLITFRVAAANHKEGEYNLPTKTYPDNPYTLQPLSAEYSSTSTLLNVDIFSLANINQPDYSGYIQNQMVLVGQSSGAQARVSNLRLLSDITSTLQGSFFIPDTTRNPSAPRFETGNKLFRLTSDEDNGVKASTRGEDEFRSEGFHDVVQETIISTRNASVEMATVTGEQGTTRRTAESAWVDDGWERIANVRFLGDPLAQTFTVDDETGVFVTKAEIYFRSKDDMDVPINFSIRTVINGTPTRTIVPETTIILDPNEVNISSDGSFATTFQFKSPVYLEPKQEYAMVLMSNSAKYEVYISRVGENDLISDTFVGQQPFGGSLFKSQNASTWEPSQWEDLKFTLYRADFLSDGTIEFYNPKLSAGNGQIPLLAENSLSFTSRQSRVGLGTTIADGGLKVGNLVIQAGTNATGNLAGFAGTAIGLNIINSGIGYTPSSGNLTFNGVDLVNVTGGGRGATANVTVQDGVISNAVITGTGGGGYQVGDVVGFNTLGVASVGRNARLSIVSIGNTNELILDQIQGNFNVGAAQTLSYVNNSGITTELNFANGLGGDVQVTSDNVISDGLHIKVNHKNHGMYSHKNKVTISGAISDIKPTKLNISYNVDSTGGISVADPSQFLQFENVGVGTTNAGYLKIENEILEYQSVSGNLINITGARGSDKFNYPVGTPVYKYELNGVSLHRINRTHDVLSVPDIDFESYNIKIDMADEGVNRTVAGYPLLYAGKTKSTGGSEVRATQNIPFEVITPMIDNITLPRTSLTAEVRTTTGVSIDGDEDQWLDEGFEPITLNEINYLETPRLVASKVNADQYLTQVKGKKSMNLRLALTSGDSRISPVIDDSRVSVILTSNNINNPITDYANDGRVNSLTEDPNACQYVSKEMMLENSASSIKILLDAHVTENADIRAFYAINNTEGKTPIFVPFPGYNNINRKGEIIDKRNNDGRSDKKVIKDNDYSFGSVTYKEYTFSVDQLPSFKTYRIKLVMTSTSQVHVPRVKDLRVLALA